MSHANADVSGPEPAAPLVRCREITHFYGGVRALSEVSLDLFPYTVTGLVGENGAGKSTLTKVLSGVIKPDAGRIWFGAEEVSRLSPAKARALGVETVYQNLELCDNLSASANVMLGQEPVRLAAGPLRFIDQRKSAEIASSRLADLGIHLVDPMKPTRLLSGGQRQAVAIARATIRGHRLMMFDEPTAALGLRQKSATLDLIRRVAERGVAVLLVSHNLDEVLSVADRVIALQLGEVTMNELVSSSSRADIEAHMSGVSRQ